MSIESSLITTILSYIFGFLTIKEHISTAKHVYKFWKKNTSPRIIINSKYNLNDYIHNIILLGVLKIKLFGYMAITKFTISYYKLLLQNNKYRIEIHITFT